MSPCLHLTRTLCTRTHLADGVPATLVPMEARIVFEAAYSHIYSMLSRDSFPRCVCVRRECALG